MLQMRPNCERCDRDLVADEPGAWICSFECTFCAACVEGDLKRRCPNCKGDLVQRPTRERALWAKHPPSTERVRKSP